MHGRPRRSPSKRSPHGSGVPFFVKPANAGSSVGVSKVSDAGRLCRLPCTKRSSSTRKVLIEEFIRGREIECAVLGNDEPMASCLGEIIPTHDFYSYEAKYLDENGALLQIPAEIEESAAQHIRQLADSNLSNALLRRHGARGLLPAPRWRSAGQ